MRSRINIVIVVFGMMSIIATGALGQDSQSGKMMKLPESQAMVGSAYDFNDTVELLIAAIEEQNLMVIKEIDAQKMLKMVNKQVGGMKQILFFHPRYMKAIVEANPMGSIEPPLKIVVMERPDHKVMVKYIKPSHMLGKYEGLGKIGTELDKIVADISSSIKK